MHHDETQSVDKSGFTLAVKSPVLDAISNTGDQAHAASHSQNDRAAALHGMAAASSALDAANGLGALANGAAPEVKVEPSYGTVAKLPDVNNLLDRQSDMLAAASAAGEAVSRRVGDFAQSKYDEAKANGDQAGMDAWKEGGIARAEMQAAGAAIVTGLAGDNAVGGAAGAGIASIAAGKLNELSGAIEGSNPTGNADMNQALGNIVANAIATGIGGAVGGNAGAVSGYDVDRYNRQLHPDEKPAIKNLANGDPDKEHRLEAAACALVQCAAEYAPGTADYAKYSALQTEGAAFTSEQAQLKNYNGTYFSTTGYGGMVQQTPGSSMFKYSAGDAQADHKSSLAAMAAQRPGSVDYVTIQYGAGVGGGLTINTHNGNVYYGASIAASRSAGGAITAGVITDNVGQNSLDKGKLTDEFLSGQSAGESGCAFGACLGVNHSMGGSTAFEFGIGFGGFTKAPNVDGNAAFGYSGQISNPLKKQ
ncbi:MAG: Putative large exoprotein involved in heme utilization or adhesion of ShlA/HecA/FhaA family [uncultured Paraburkholderia sp.]|nr:MAG: Putative large exoprotein involved in heme utilization or adhesion of ShlA/HecA/FhaA family [uncultured Paraburkholderia sp.]